MMTISRTVTLFRIHRSAPLHRMAIALGLAFCALAHAANSANGFEWQAATPESHGLSSAKLDALKNDLAAEKLSLGLAKVTGAPPDFRGINLRAPSIESVGNDVRGHKASGILMVDGVLHLLARNRGNAQLASSRDHGAIWSWADWKFTESFGAPAFINFGRNYAGARDEFVYMVSHDSDTA